jgi:hypothetical protein
MMQDIFFEKPIVTQLVKQQPAFFMEPEGSLPCSQNPATEPYPEPAKSNSLHRSLGITLPLPLFCNGNETWDLGHINEY